MSTFPDYFDPSSKIAQCWAKPLSESASLPTTTFTAPEKERHTIYSLLLMAIVKDNWNGNKNGARDGEYPWRQKQKRTDGSYLGDKQGDRYIGHNIGALAVDGQGRIVDFDFNHNKIFNSSVQHAEARLIRRLFSLAAVQDSWDLTAGQKKYRTDLKETTVYTSLESCAQCAGIMALANLPRVVYIQPDPGQYMIGQLLRNLSDVPTAEHIPASVFGFTFFDQLIEAYKEYRKGVEEGAVFWRSNNNAASTDLGKAITSFLCTDLALGVYTSATDNFNDYVCTFGDFSPINVATGANAMTNNDVLSHAREFLNYTRFSAQRGTPHFN